MNRSELNAKAKKHLSDAGFGTGTNITLNGAKCLMVDFYLNNQIENIVVLPDATRTATIHHCGNELTEKEIFHEYCLKCGAYINNDKS